MWQNLCFGDEGKDEVTSDSLVEIMILASLGLMIIVKLMMVIIAVRAGLMTMVCDGDE